MREEPLHDVLRVGRRIPAPADECVKWRPIRFAESSERFTPGLISLGLAGLQNDCPVRRLKRRTTLLERTWNRLRNEPQYEKSGVVWPEETIRSRSAPVYSNSHARRNAMK